MKEKITYFVLGMALVGSVAIAENWGKHPHLHNAHEAIERAKNQLTQANDHKQTEFGGHREKAIQLLNQAQQEVVASVEYANSNAK